MKVSVIIPVYKVEKYLRRCVNSIINQDFEDYEIILVDDGSPDGCPAICDEYAALYTMIRVIHKENGGLSDARNVAVVQAKGDYILFVDSDDYVDRNHISSLWDRLERNNADMVCSPPVIEYETSGMAINDNPEGDNKRKETFPELCVGTREAQAIILRGYPVGTSACSKIIKKEHCLKHPFPKGKVMEELATIYHVVGETKKVAFIGIPTYHYVQRAGSILHTSFSLKEVDEYMGMAEQYAIHAPTIDIKRAAAVRLILLAGRLSCASNKKEENMIYHSIVKYCRKYLKYYITDKKMSSRERLRAILMSISPFTIRMFVWRKKKINMYTSIE